MYYIYMDNFRGFRDTIIPFQKANFLIGENSTGKSSFLTLIALFSNAGFWFDQNFSPGTFSNLGGFSDILSIKSNIRNRFSVGMLLFPDENLSNNDPEIRFAFMTFKNEEGMPKLVRYIQYTDGRLLKVLYLPQKTRYKTSKYSQKF